MVQTLEDSGHRDKRHSSGKFSIVLIVYEMGVVATCLNACMLHYEISHWLQEAMTKAKQWMAEYYTYP